MLCEPQVLEVVLHALEAEKDVRHVLCATHPWKACDVCWRLEDVHHVLLYMLEAVEGELCLLEVPEVMCCVMLCISEAAGRGLRLLEVPEVMSFVLSVCWRL